MDRKLRQSVWEREEREKIRGKSMKGKAQNAGTATYSWNMLILHKRKSLSMINVVNRGDFSAQQHFVLWDDLTGFRPECKRAEKDNNKNNGATDIHRSKEREDKA